MIDFAKASFPHLTADILPDNTASLALHKSKGFVLAVTSPQKLTFIFQLQESV